MELLTSMIKEKNPLEIIWNNYYSTFLKVPSLVKYRFVRKGIKSLVNSLDWRCEFVWLVRPLCLMYLDAFDYL